MVLLFSKSVWLGVAITCCASACFSLAETPAIISSSDTKTISAADDRRAFKQEFAVRRPNLLAKLISSDPSTVADAVIQIDGWADSVPSIDRPDVLGLLIEAKRFSDFDELAIKYMLKSPANTGVIARIQKLEVTSLLKQGNTAKAIVQAKIYYNICHFEDTKDAINLIAVCLISADPKDQSTVERFRAQQVFFSTHQTDATTTAPNFGDSVLKSIELGPSPFETAARQKVPTGYISFESKGNLLLLAGRFEEARTTFEQAYEVASEKQLPGAIENIARCLRAADGDLGRANEFLAKSEHGDANK